VLLLFPFRFARAARHKEIRFRPSSKDYFSGDDSMAHDRFSMAGALACASTKRSSNHGWPPSDSQ